MRFKKVTFLSVLFLFLMSFTVLGAAAYIKDDAGVLSSSTIQQVNTNLAQLEKNTGAQVRIVTIKSLQGKNINDYAANVVKTSTSTDKYAIFIVSIGDHKNKFVVGNGLNAVFTSSEAEKIQALPNSYFKNNDFNTGILKVGKAIDEDITTKAVKENKVKVVDNGLGKTVQPKKSYTGLIIFLILLAVLAIGIVYYLKKKSKERVERFARENDLNNDSHQESKGFKSANLSEEEPIYNRPSSNINPGHGGPGVVNNTTVINQNGGYGYGGNGFVEGMIVGDMLSHNHHEDHHDYDDHHNSHRNDYNNDNSNSSLQDDEDTKISSGSWGISGGDSDWGSSSDGGSDWGSSSSDSSSSDSSSDW